MLLPATYQALGILLLAIVPGYVATTFWARARTWKGHTTDLLTVLQSLAVSVIIQISLSWLTLWWLYPFRASLDQHPWHVAGWVALVTLFVPVIGGSLAGWLNNKMADPNGAFTQSGFGKRFAKAFPWAGSPTIWDWTFQSKILDGRFVIIEFEDGKRVAGVHGEGGMAITSPEPPGLFLPQEWVLDEVGNIDAPLSGSAGVMIPNTAKIRLVRVLLEGDSSSGQEQRDQDVHSDARRDEGAHPRDEAPPDNPTT